MISRTQMEKFVNEYLSTTERQSTAVPRSCKILLFPEYLSTPHRIRGTISSSFGVAIRFAEFSPKWDIEVSFTSNRITDEVLPRLSNSGVPLMQVQGTNTHIVNINFITREFFDRYEKIITALSKATNFRLDAIFSRFIDLTAGDVRLVDVSFATLMKAKTLSTGSPDSDCSQATPRSNSRERKPGPSRFNTIDQ